MTSSLQHSRGQVPGKFQGAAFQPILLVPWITPLCPPQQVCPLGGTGLHFLACSSSVPGVMRVSYSSDPCILSSSSYCGQSFIFSNLDWAQTALMKKSNFMCLIQYELTGGNVILNKEIRKSKKLLKF